MHRPLLLFTKILFSIFVCFAFYSCGEPAYCPKEDADYTIKGDISAFNFFTHDKDLILIYRDSITGIKDTFTWVGQGNEGLRTYHHAQELCTYGFNATSTFNDNLYNNSKTSEISIGGGSSEYSSDGTINMSYYDCRFIPSQTSFGCTLYLFPFYVGQMNDENVTCEAILHNYLVRNEVYDEVFVCNTQNKDDEDSYTMRCAPIIMTSMVPSSLGHLEIALGL